ncbi:MAG TPA: HAMP domain-containing protein [Myxococcota bacterium]
MQEHERRDRRLPRLPLPAKLFLSYVVVIAVAAAPTFFYVRSRLGADLLQLAEVRLREGTRRAASGLMPYSDTVVARLRAVSAVIPQRVTLIAPSGEVLFDSDSIGRDNHAERPEIVAARQARPLVDVAVARRWSASTGKDTVYAATRLVDDGPVLRLADDVDNVLTAATDLKGFSRNVSALAITFGVVLSLLSVVLFVRPLRRVVATAQALAKGDLSARSSVDSDDEIGDAGRALDQMALDLRRRLANAGSGDAVLAQLVDALPVPCVIIEPSGEPLALNGPARRALRLEGTNARRRVQQVAASGRFKRAVAEAEIDGDPEPCVIIADDGTRFEGTVHVLKRPGAPPLSVLLGHETPEDAHTALPISATSTGVVAIAFVDVLKDARDRARAVLNELGVLVEVDDEPEIMLADVDGRLARALGLVLEGCARGLSGKGDLIAVDVHVEATRLRLCFGALPTDGFVDSVRPIVGPLGGDVGIVEGEVRLWLPRA